MSNVEKEYNEVKSELKKVGDDLKTYAETAQKEIKASQKMSEETKASVDKLLIAQGELQARLQAAEQLLAKAENAAAGRPSAPKSLGEQVAESDAYKDVKGKSGWKGSFAVNLQAAAITTEPGSAGALVEPMRVPGIVVAPNQRLFIRDLITAGRTQSGDVEFAREVGYTNNAAPVRENPSNPKPESGITFELDTAKVATIAHWIPASRQVIDDAPMLASYIDGRLRYGLKLKEELQLLKGSGVGLNIHGVMPQASAYVNPGVNVQAETMIDRLRLALLQAELAEYYADGIVLSPIDWAAIELTKDSTNNYLFAAPQRMSTAGLWSRPIVPTQAMDQGDFLVGAWSQGAQIWDREDVNVRVSYEDRDNFVKNMVTILCEERLALTVYRPEAFVKGTFDDLQSS